MSEPLRGLVDTASQVLNAFQRSWTLSKLASPASDKGRETMSYTIMTIIDKQVVTRYEDASWRDVIDHATEVDEFEEQWTDHWFLEQVADHGQAMRRHHDGVGTVLRIAFRNPLSLNKH